MKNLPEMFHFKYIRTERDLRLCQISFFVIWLLSIIVSRFDFRVVVFFTAFTIVNTIRSEIHLRYIIRKKEGYQKYSIVQSMKVTDLKRLILNYLIAFLLIYSLAIVGFYFFANDWMNVFKVEMILSILVAPLILYLPTWGQPYKMNADFANHSDQSERKPLS